MSSLLTSMAPRLGCHIPLPAQRGPMSQWYYLENQRTIRCYNKRGVTIKSIQTVHLCKVNLPQAGSQQTPWLQKTKDRCEASILTAAGPFLKSANLRASASPDVTLVQLWTRAVSCDVFTWQNPFCSEKETENLTVLVRALPLKKYKPLVDFKQEHVMKSSYFGWLNFEVTDSLG